MKNSIRFLLGLFLLGLFLFSFSGDGLSAEGETKKDDVCSLYLTGIGCSHCAVTDSFIFRELTAENPNLIIIEYEIFQDRRENQEVYTDIYEQYLDGGLPRVPFWIFSKQVKALGDESILEFKEKVAVSGSNKCPLPNGGGVSFRNLDIKGLSGKFKIWSKDRVLISGQGSTNEVLRKVILTEDVSAALFGVNFEETEPLPVEISQAKMEFDNAVMIDGWRLQWNGEPYKVNKGLINSLGSGSWRWVFSGLVIFCFFFLLSVLVYSKKFSEKEKKTLRIRSLVVVGSLFVLFLFFLFTQNINPGYMKNLGGGLPLPIFTILIALVDGFNPCNIFVLSCLLTILISSSGSKKRLYLVSGSFVFMVFLIYFFFMCAWLNVFSLFSFVSPLRIGIAVVALVVGLINCKEMVFFKKGISLTIPQEQRSFLVKKMRGLREVINTGSFGLLILSSVGLASLASLVELPCTAGFPIVYTGILSGKVLENDLLYYGYIFLYNVVYIIPLVVIISIFVYTLKTKQITQRQVQIIKFIGGFIMIILGLVLLLNPALLGINIK